MKTLVVLEVSQKQRYIFITNKLSRNVGASITIRVLTGEDGKNGEEKCNDGTIPDPSKDLVKGRYVFAGGGRSIYEFDSQEDAKKFIRSFSTKAVRDCPGIELFMAEISYDPAAERIENAIDRLYGELEKKKALRQEAFHYYGPGCAVRSVELQQPAVEIRDGQALSAEEVFKSDVALRMQDKFFAPLLPDSQKYRFAREFNEMGGTYGVKDYIAVISIDGNKMGEKIHAFADSFHKRYPDSNDMTGRNETYKKEFRAFSESLDCCYHNAVKKSIAMVAEHMNDLIDADGTDALSFNMKKDGKLILPLRPLILSGDDICVVCDARIGLSLAETILEEIEKEHPAEGMDLHACAGVAMVHSHYPFFRAHALAEELLSNAKSILPLDPSQDESVMDFLVVQGEITGDLGTIRQVQYRNGMLTDKPLYLHEGKNRRNSLPYYHKRMEELSQAAARSKLKEYRDALYEGKSRAQEYVNYLRIGGDNGEKFVNGGYDNRDNCDHSIDFDLIEIMDLNTPIAEES